MGFTPDDGRDGLRLHQLIVGGVSALAYLVGWPPLLWVALGLSVAALVSPRFAVVARLCALVRRRQADAAASLRYGPYRFDEAVRAALLGAGLVLLATSGPVGWLPILAASATAILEGATGFVVTTVLYALMKKAAGRVPPPDPEQADRWNPDCLVPRALGEAPYPHCRWCRLPSIRWCCGLQVSLLLMLLLVIAFLLDAAFGPVMTKLLVAMSILTVVALGVAIKRQTDGLVDALDETAAERARDVARCAVLERLAAAESVELAAETALDHIVRWTGARRASVMVAQDGVLRIAASLGIPAEVAGNVAVPLSARICGRVFSTGRPVVFHDPAREVPDLALGLEGKGASASWPLLSAPMGMNGRKVGCINATDTPAGEFTPADLAEMEFTAGAAGISLATQVARHDLERANYDTIRALALAVEAKDPYTHGHSSRVQVWATAVGRELGFDDRRLQALAYAAELHDVGKLAVPDSILRAERALTEDEWFLVRQHPVRGVQMVQHLRFLKPSLPAILHHHERVDGRGYPEGLRNEEIPQESQILAVVDSYDAMTSLRPYRVAMGHDEAAAELQRCTGTQFDPECVRTFLRMLADAAESPIATAARAGALPPRSTGWPQRKPPAVRAAR